MGLELYGKIEELFLDKEAAFILWGKFIEILKKVESKNVLDIGCGSGGFCKFAKENGLDVKGIDLSYNQVKRAKNCECEVKDVCEVKEKFDVAVSIFDVINYMDKKELKRFFSCVEKVIDRYFIFDINSYFAMSELAIGTLKAENDKKFSVLYSTFEDNKLITEITLFEKEGECFKKMQKYITQYYYSIEELENLTNLKLKEKIPISLYGSGEVEKWILLFEK